MLLRLPIFFFTTLRFPLPALVSSWRLPAKMRRTALLFTLLSSIIGATLVIVDGYPFRDVSIQAGLDYSGGRRLKYGGPCVADLNGDGFPDLILAHHNERFARVYLNTGKGTFNKLRWQLHADTHSIVPYRARPADKTMHFLVARGGGYGLKPESALLFKMEDDGQVVRLESPRFGRGRGRTALFLPLNPWAPRINHVVLINRPALDRSSTNSAGRVLGDGTLKGIRLSGFGQETNAFATVTDVDGDRMMEFLTYHDELRIYKVVAPFVVKEVSKNIVPKRLLPMKGVIAVAELDFDNDGKMDLYIARTTSGSMKWLQRSIGGGPSDYLLRNVGGRYVDVTSKAGIPKGGESRGVTVGDFNNDGFIDIIVTQFTRAHRLLWNKGDGTFRNQLPNFGRNPNVHSDALTAVDYNLDGRLDVILSEGDFMNRGFGGYFRIMKNIGRRRNFLLVRVGSSPRVSAISLHAIATVRVGKRSMMRRVGPPGTASSVSYIELLHFGLGSARSAEVMVKWADGSTQRKWNVRANSLVIFGMI